MPLQHIVRIALSVILAASFASRQSSSHADAADVEAHTRFAIDDENPMARVPTEDEKNANPLEFAYYLQELLDRAERATKQRDHAGAARYYMAVAAAVPDRATAFSKLCEALDAGGQQEQALEACRGALGRPGATLADSVRMVKVLLAKPGALTDAEVDEAFAVAAHLQKSNDTKIAGLDLECDVARRVGDAGRLRACTSAIVEAAPESPRAIALAWSLAVENGNKGEAERWLHAAEDSRKVPADVIAKMSEATAQVPALWKRVITDWRALVSLFVAAACALLAMAAVKRRGGRVSDRVAV